MWGIDRLSAGELGNTRRRLRNSSVALLTQASAVDRHGRPVLDVLEDLGVRPVRIFEGEESFEGVAQAEEAVLSPAAPLDRLAPATRTADVIAELERDSHDVEELESPPEGEGESSPD